MYVYSHILDKTVTYTIHLLQKYVWRAKKTAVCFMSQFQSLLTVYSVCYTGYYTVRCKVRTLFIYLASTQFTDHFI